LTYSEIAKAQNIDLALKTLESATTGAKNFCPEGSHMLSDERQTPGMM
jgi:hypothetical protein